MILPGVLFSLSYFAILVLTRVICTFPFVPLDFYLPVHIKARAIQVRHYFMRASMERCDSTQTMIIRNIAHSELYRIATSCIMN